MKKAQLLSIDAIFALLIFATIVLGFELVFSHIVAISDARIELIAYQANDLLLNRQGMSNFSNGVVGIMGPSVGTISTTRLKNFLAMDYNQSRKRLGIAPYRYYFNLTRVNGSLYFVDSIAAEKGEKPVNASNTAIMRTPVLINNELVISHLVVWE